MKRNMWRVIPVAAAVLAAGLIACDRPARSAGDESAADNTAKNVRDRDGKTVTPLDQSNSQADIDLTAKIRKALTDDDALSTSAKNVKVVSQNGQVTLRGPVASESERSVVTQKATQIAGAGHVTSQLEVAP